MSYLKGRMNRATYWFGVAILVFPTAFLALFAPWSALVSGAILTILAIPRLHDTGRTAWWAPAVFGIEIAGLIVTFFALPPQHVLPMVGLLLLLAIGLMTWLGAMRGTEGPNRFGDPQLLGLQWNRK